MPSGSRPRSWSTTSPSRSSACARSAARHVRWWSRAASSAPSSTSPRSVATWPRSRAIPGDRGVLRRARVTAASRSRRPPSTASRPTRRRAHRRGPLPLPGLPDKFQTGYGRAAAAHDVRGQGAVGRQGGPDPVAPEQGTPAQARRVRARLHERQRHHQAAFADYYDPPSWPTRPTRTSSMTSRQSLTEHRCTHTSSSTTSSSCTSAGPTETAWTPSSTPAWRPTRRSWTRTARSTSRARPRRSHGPTPSWPPSCPTPTRRGSGSRSCWSFLVPSCPAVEEDLSQACSMPSTWTLPGREAGRHAHPAPRADARIDPVPASGGGRMPEPELDRLSNILLAFNDQFGNIAWTDEDRLKRLITDEIRPRRRPMRVSERAPALGQGERPHRA